MAKTVRTDNFSEPVSSATTATIDIDARDGNLTIDQLAGGEEVFASGTLQYLENQDPPSRTFNVSDGRAAFTLQGSDSGRPWFRLPWAACNGATEWQIHLNPTVALDITAHSGGGNVNLNLGGMSVTRVAAETGGGNVDVVLPDRAADLRVAARAGAGNVTVDLGSGITGNNSIDANSGAGNVVVRVPGGVAARIHATTGLGKVIVDPRFDRIDANTYRSPDYDSAADRVEITVKSGAGNVSVSAS